ncbi:autotransporter family protein [Aliihoeflea aestuarii]|uniref:autotransporter family protein n=1 Tax=Aliihoeflea aestuarii TaxID=453840 RepID=UPI002095E302|nr:autotransporter outer membrane beta-barrel domain-containing protein [Aliihoeflea aestuarii]
MSTSAKADCVFFPGPGDDIYICDSGTSPGGLTDTSGNNTLLLPSGGTGIVNGNVAFGGGQDRIEIGSGTIQGAVDQGAGTDFFVISGGTVTGNVQQGAGIDDFQMTGGVIGSLNQGDGLDTFFMSDGRIVDFFDDGDRAIMTGGRIGRVNMKLDRNFFDMSGGTIDRNLVTGFDVDTVILSGGFIGGNVSVSGGNDSVTVTGGAIGGSVLMSFGADDFVWDSGGIIYGAVDMGPDADTARLANLTAANLGATTRIDGGLGIDALTMENVKATGIARFVNWEAISAANDTELTFDGTLTLGDSGTGTGTLSLDATSTIYGGGGNFGVTGVNGAASLLNAGRIDLTNGTLGPANRFTVSGDYTGSNGLLLVDTVLADDASASDQLVISGGTATGATSIAVTNAGGTGALTVQNGILVVEAINGATTTAGAFSLGSRVAAGAYEYLLFRGGVTDGSGENWYLRSTLTAGPTPAPVQPGPTEPIVPVDPDPEAAAPPPLEQPVPELPPESTPTDPDPVDPAPPVDVTDGAPVAPPEAAEASAPTPPPPPPVAGTAPAPLPGAGGLTTPPNPGATPVVADIVPLYRTEVATYSAIAPAAHHLGLSALGTFHERRGEQPLLDGAGFLPASWGRVYGQDFDFGWQGAVSPQIDGSLVGFQVGQDIFGRETDGVIDRIGVFVGQSSLSGDVTGQALGWNGYAVGDIDADAFSFGGYWTRIGPSGWYIDTVLMGSRFDGDARSVDGERIGISGRGFTASVESGVPFALSPGWTIEPQAQLIWQSVSLSDRADRFSTVSFDADDALTGRIGARLHGTVETESMTVRPYLKANLWHDFGSDHVASFAATPIVTQTGGTRLELGAGVVADVSTAISAFATASYTTALSGDTDGHSISGNVGLRVKW